MTREIGFALLFNGVLPLIAGALALREQKQISRQIWLRRIKGFWLDFSHNKIGLLGLVIVFLYVAMGFLQPILATHDPELRTPAIRYAAPEWIAIFSPELRDAPRTVFEAPEWKWDALPEGATIQYSGGEAIIRYEGDESIVIPLHLEYSYLWDPPHTFEFNFTYDVGLRFVDDKATARYSLELKLTTPDGTVYPLWDQHWQNYRTSGCYLKNPGKGPTYYPGSRDYSQYGYGIYEEKYGGQIPTWETNQSNVYVHYGDKQDTLKRLGYKPWQPQNMTRDLFSPPGENYTMQMYVTIKPTKPNALCEVTLSKLRIHVPGVLWGLLGTEHWGRDCWSRLVYGARVSLAVGLAAAVISTLLGIVVGVTSGYFGGIVDEALMRIVDILICLPLLPLLLVLIYMWGRNILYIVLLIAVFGWLGLSRMVRSQILSIREMPFVESARASGASSFYIMFRHLVPNVMPLVMTDFILTIPGAILLEAALSFIGFGDPSTPTWGREYSFMQDVATSTLAQKWWWSIPPGLMITMLCVGFVFLGHAIDEIINPKLRRRR
jgi:ABC-type dipeptide/oligopeptide/nickel transport system permease subunit